MELNVNIELTEVQERLLIEIDIDGCYEPVYTYDEEEEDLHVLCNLGVVESILGEQFFVTRLGKLYIEKLINGTE